VGAGAGRNGRRRATAITATHGATATPGATATRATAPPAAAAITTATHAAGRAG